MARTKLELLADVALLAQCSPKELKHVAKLVDEASVAAGRVLTTEGQPGNEAYVVVSGTAEVTVRGAAVATVGPGEAIGEMALLDRASTRSATVTATTDMDLLVLDPRSFNDLLLEHPTVTRSIAVGLAQRLRVLEGSHLS